MRKPKITHSRVPAGRICALVAGVLSFTLLYPSVRLAHADAAIGTSTGDFLGFEVGASSAGLAGANTSVAGGVSSQYWNPSLLAAMTRPQVSMMHASWLGSLKYDWIGYARPVGSRAGVTSLSVAYFHMPGLNGFDDIGNPTGELKVYDMAMTLGYARPLTRGFYLGANAKYLRQSLAGVAMSGPAADLGMSAVFAGTTLGAVVQNVGPSLSYGGSHYPLPQQAKFGVSRLFLSDRLLLAADYNIPKTYYKDWRVGAEIRPHPMIAVRAGYRREFGVADDPATGLSYGLGAHVGPIDVDYAMTPNNAFSDVHRLSFGYSFGSAPAKPEPERPEPKRPAKPEQSTPPAIAAVPKTQAKPPAAAQETPKQAPVPPAPAPVAQAAPAAPEPAPTQPSARTGSDHFEVVLGNYQSEASAQSEIKALQMLGFSVKNVRITFVPSAGYRVSFVPFKSRKAAEDLAASLKDLSFTPRIEVVQQ